MRRQCRGSVIRITAALGAVAMTGACAHNDVLVFGTSTTIGLNVETVSAGGAPSIVLGFEREEAVWMPLVLNGNDSKLALCAADAHDQCTTGPVPVSQAMYQSGTTYADGRTSRDTYSVFASLGARFNTEAQRERAQAGGGLAQFFATGGAALNITENEALVTALKVESEGGAIAQAEAVQGAALSEERLTALRSAHEAREAEVAFIVRCAATPATRWDAMVDRAYPDIPADRPRQLTRQRLKGAAADQRTRLFVGHPDWILEMAKAAVAEGCTR